MPNELNEQVGAPIVNLLPPEFEGYEVVDDSWKPKDLLAHEDHKNARSVIFNTTFYGPGTEVDCELFQYLSDPPAQVLAKSMVISEKETADNPNPGQWLVLKADPMKFGGRGSQFSVTLRRTADQDLNNTTPVS